MSACYDPYPDLSDFCLCAKVAVAVAQKTLPFSFKRPSSEGRGDDAVSRVSGGVSGGAENGSCGSYAETADLSNDDKLRLYALYKVATVGKPVGGRPSILNYVERMKFDAWTACAEEEDWKGAEEVEAEYIAFARSCLPIIDEVMRKREEDRSRMREMTVSAAATTTSQSSSRAVSRRAAQDQPCSKAASPGHSSPSSRTDEMLTSATVAATVGKQTSPERSNGSARSVARPPLQLPSNLHRPFGKSLNALSTRMPNSIIPRSRLEVSYSTIFYACLAAGMVKDGAGTRADERQLSNSFEADGT